MEDLRIQELPAITVALDWYLYFCMRDDATTSIAVDLTFGDDSSDRDLSWVTIIEIDLLDPVGGLAFDREAEVLDGIAEMFEDVSNHLPPGLLGRIFKRPSRSRFRYVGRVTGNGSRRLYFYGTAAVPAIVYERVFAVPEFRVYNVGSLEREDPERAMYREDLHPGGALNAIVLSDAQVETRKEAGDDLDVTREVEHAMWFSTEEDRRRFVEMFEREDTTRMFTVVTTAAPTETKRFGVTLGCKHSVDKMWTNIYVVALAKHAAKFGGTYDGWGAPVVQRLET